MADFDPFNATPTQWAENSFNDSTREAFSAIHLSGSEKQYREAMARAIGGMCSGLASLTRGLRATYAATHKLNQRIAHLERSLGNGNK
ncbi:MAG: hypothetical protein IT173_04800 [Acidobacteria bacterium]|nr:hypothetical protein [Acidobacteriota bacterium]